MYCQKCGKEIDDDAVVCAHCGCLVNQAQPLAKASKQDKANIGLGIVSFIVPVFGWIYGGIRYSEHPKSSKTYITCGIVGFVLNLLVFLF